MLVIYDLVGCDCGNGYKTLICSGGSWAQTSCGAPFLLTCYGNPTSGSVSGFC
jgi:hypothetical protein